MHIISREIRTNENITVDRERGILTIDPKITLKFIRNESVAGLEDLSVYVPNIALIVSTNTKPTELLSFLWLASLATDQNSRDVVVDNRGKPGIWLLCESHGLPMNELYEAKFKPI